MGQALSGMMRLTEEADGAAVHGSPISDCAAGLTLFGAIDRAVSQGTNRRRSVHRSDVGRPALRNALNSCPGSQCD